MNETRNLACFAIESGEIGEVWCQRGLSYGVLCGEHQIPVWTPHEILLLAKSQFLNIICWFLRRGFSGYNHLWADAIVSVLLHALHTYAEGGRVLRQSLTRAPTKKNPTSTIGTPPYEISHLLVMGGSSNQEWAAAGWGFAIPIVLRFFFDETSEKFYITTIPTDHSKTVILHADSLIS